MDRFTHVGSKENTADEPAWAERWVGRRHHGSSAVPVQDERLDFGRWQHDDHGSSGVRRLQDATEYHFISSGWVQYLDVETGLTHDVVAGEFCAIGPNTFYAQKWKPGTEIVFVRVPSIQVDRPTTEPDMVTAWRKERLTTRRRDYWHDRSAPPANSVRPAVAVAVIDTRGRLLLLRRRDSGNWTMPGGTIDHDDSLIGCAVREVFEETGFDVTVTDIIGTYTDPEALVAYSDGEVRREFTILLAAEAVHGDATIDGESTDFGWYSVGDIEHLPVAESQRRRIRDVGDYLEFGGRNLG